MLFNSFAFLVFFPLVCTLYFLIPVNKWRNIFLLLASYYFYMISRFPRGLWIMFISLSAVTVYPTPGIY